MKPRSFAAFAVPVVFRTVLRHRKTYLPATAILILGIGASVAMFTLVDAVLLRPLPFPSQESIEVIWKTTPLAGTGVEEMAYPELDDLRENIPDFEYVAVLPTSLYGYGRVLQRGNSEPIEIESAPVSHDFFRVLGVTPVIGRDFSDSDEHIGAPPVVILSDRVWRGLLGADRAILGSMIRLNGQGYTVIGVMAPGVEFPRGAGLWVPLGVDQRVIERRSATFLQAIARVKPGRPLDAATGQVNALFHRLAAEHPEVYAPSQQAVVIPLAEYWTGSARVHLIIMFSAALLLLAAAVISATNLLLSGTMLRRAEFSTRLALGAGSGQILAQLAAEGAVVAIAAALGGMALAQSAVRALVRLAPGDIPRLPEAALDWRGFLVASAAAALAVVVCSLIAGWPAASMQWHATLGDASGRSSPSRAQRRIRRVFVLTQTAVTVTLLSLAVLLFLSYRSMIAADTGFANRDTLSMNLVLRGPGLFSAQAVDLNSRRAFYTSLLDRLRESPGVTSAAAVLVRPLEGPIGWDRSYEFEFEAGTTDPRALPKANFEVVTPGYFQTVGTPLLEGRDFTEHDAGESVPVVIVSQTLARRIRAAGRVPLGSRLRLGSGNWSTVIGVSADARYRNITLPGPDIFVPYLQAEAPTNYVVIRGTQSRKDLAALVRRKLSELDSSQALSGEATIGELIDRNSARHRFNMTLLAGFAVCAAWLSALGVYSVIAGASAFRRRELAIKTALGAQKPRLVREVVATYLAFVIVGEIVGVAGVAALEPFTSPLVYGVSPLDPMVLASVGVFVFLVSSAAAFWPAWKVAGADPQVSLKTA